MKQETGNRKMKKVKEDLPEPNFDIEDIMK